MSGFGAIRIEKPFYNKELFFGGYRSMGRWSRWQRNLASVTKQVKNFQNCRNHSIDYQCHESNWLEALFFRTPTTKTFQFHIQLHDHVRDTELY